MSSFQLILNGTPAEEDFYDKIMLLEVEENADLPGAIQLKLPVTRSDDGDLTIVNEPRFQPLATIAVVATPEGKAEECIFDGVLLSQKLHLEQGVVSSYVEIWGQDSSWLMNLEEKAREWVDVTDANVAAAIFNEYGVTPAPENTQEDSPSHSEDGHSLMQRASDIQFLRSLARRNGKLCRVVCAAKPGERTGYFAKPNLDTDPLVIFSPNDPEGGNVGALDLEWDVTRPTAVQARQALFTDASEDGATGDVIDSGLTKLDERDLATFAGKPMKVMLTAPVDDGGELTLRAQSLLRESGWFARCAGEADAGRLGAVLRAGTVAQVDGIGSINSGKFLVWSVRHSFTRDAHKMRFEMVRNAMGPAPAGGAGGLLAGLL